MKGRVLIVANVFTFIGFLKNDIRIYKDAEYDVVYASNMFSDMRLGDSGQYDYLGVNKINISFGRSPFSKENIKAYKQLKKVIDNKKFDIIHCHTPIAAAIVRMVARKSRKNGTKIIYTSHGFHFHKRSGIKQWILYYPLECFLAMLTDCIITINKEDYGVLKHYKVNKKKYIPGVGVDIEKIKEFEVDFELERNLIGIDTNDFVIISIGELSPRKNQEIIIKAIGKIKCENIKYLICGDGPLLEQYKQLALQLGIENQILFMGHCGHDMVIKYCKIADIGAFPSKIEGLGLAGIEIMAAGKPIVASNVHGIKDYVKDSVNGVLCEASSVDEFCDAIYQLYNDRKYYNQLKMHVYDELTNFSTENSYSCLKNILNEYL